MTVPERSKPELKPLSFAGEKLWLLSIEMLPESIAPGGMLAQPAAVQSVDATVKRCGALRFTVDHSFVVPSG
jgi:hypothetical protein